MTSPVLQIARILVAPWLRETRTLVGFGVLALLVAFAPAGLVLIHDGSGENLAGPLVIYTVVAAALAVAGAWVLTVANVLDQNHPTLARLVPGHAHALRRALVAGTFALTFACGLPFGLYLESASAGMAIAAILLATFAVGVRWVWIWLPVNLALPFVTAHLSARELASSLASLSDLWGGAPATAAAVVVVASAVLVASVVQTGGAVHERFHARRMQLRRRVADMAPTALPTSATARWMARPYAWWFERQLARRGTTMARLMLGLGQTGHWTTHAGYVTATLAGASILVGLLACSPFASGLPALLAGLGFSAIFGLLLLPLQAGQRLWSRRREQALLALLPGMPRDVRLNRALALRLMAHYLLAWLCATALVALLLSTADSLAPGIAARGLGPMLASTLLGMLSLGPVLLRRWAAMGSASSGGVLLVCLAAIALTGLAVWLHDEAGCTLVSIAGAYIAFTAVAGAWRWRRIATGPSALPVGRMAA